MATPRAFAHVVLSQLRTDMTPFGQKKVSTSFFVIHSVEIVD